jgi:hypothetical protein
LFARSLGGRCFDYRHEPSPSESWPRPKRSAT